MAAVLPARRDDLAAVSEIYAHHVGTGVAGLDLSAPDEQEWTERFTKIADLGLPFLVAEQNGEVLEYAYCGPWRPRLAYHHTAENSLYPRPSAVGRGLGGTLLGELLQRSRAAGVHQMIAVITAADGTPVEPASVAVHKRHGFTRPGGWSRSATSTAGGWTCSATNGPCEVSPDGGDRGRRIRSTTPSARR